MKAIYTISSVLLLSMSSLFAQGKEITLPALDTIYANDQKNVALFFPDPIKQGITGSDRFVFTYNREQRQHLGLLQATPGEESNLLVISNSGSVFSYIVMYSERLDKLNYFICESGSIGTEDPTLRQNNVDGVKTGEGILTPHNILLEKEAEYRNFSSYLLRSKQKIKKSLKTKESIALKVKNIVFQGEELYFAMEIENRSPIDYEVNYLNIAVETRQKGKKKSIQKLTKEPFYRFQEPAKILKGKTSRFVYVLPKFAIAEDKVVIIDLKEQNGERDIKLKLNQKIINNPN
ncbi:MAG: DUF4138 domain-containing protein [Gillisia sp.]